MTHERWFTVWMLLAGVLMLILVGFSLNTWTRLDQMQAQLDHIDAHFQAPEPTPRSNGRVG